MPDGRQQCPSNQLYGDVKITSIHHTLQNPISQSTFALETKIFSFNGNETRTHEGFINTYATRTAEVETTELPVLEEE